MAESSFQSKVAKHYRQKGCYVIVVTVVPGVPTGCPDIIVLAPSGKWFTLECKQSASSPFRPLQEPTIAKLDRMGYSRVVYPANWEQIKRETEKLI